MNHALHRRTRQTHWVSNAPVIRLRPLVGAAARCPLVPLVGACCSGCAHGGSCQGEDELRHEMGRSMVGLFDFIEKAMPWSEAETLNAQAEQLNADLTAGLKAALVAEPGGNATWADITSSWGTFYPEWKAWFAEKKDSPAGTFGLVAENLERFKAFASAFDLARQKAVDAGVKTSVKATDLRSPIAQGLESAGQGLGSGISSALDTLGQGLVWGGILLAGGLVLYLAGPPLIAKVLA